MSAPRGLRNRNPGNIVVSGWTQRQDGYTGPEPEGRFATFATMAHGLAALMRLLQVYRRQHNLSTVRGAINRWAPPTENDTSAYVVSVARALNVEPDAELPDTPATYNLLARAIAAHENGRDAARDGISTADWSDAMRMVFENMQAPAAEPVGPSPSQPTRPAPAPYSPPRWPFEDNMPLPVPALIALGAELLKVIPWGKKRTERIEDVAPVLIEIAKQVSPAGVVNEQAAVQKVLSDPETKAQFISAVAVRWDDLAPLLEYEARERKEAREFVGTLTTGDNWRAIGAGVLIGLLAITIVVGGGFMFYQFMQSPNVSSDQKSMILGALLTAFSAVIFFFFGSSRSSQMKDETIANAARKQ